jgi:hypothetical protein
MRTGKTRYDDGQVLSVPAMRKDGKHISVAFTILPFIGSSGVLTGIAAVMRDVTEQFEEVRALRRDLAASRALVQNESRANAGGISPDTDA